MQFCALIIFFVCLFSQTIWGKVISFPEPINEITGLRSAGKATESKQRAIWRTVSRIAKNIQKAESNPNNVECDECLKRGSGAVRIKRLLETNTQKKQYARGIENRITYDIYSKSDIPQSFYYRPFIDSKVDIMSSLIYSIEIDESPLQDFQETVSAKQATIQKTKKELFKLVIQAEQPLSELTKIQKEYKKSGADIIAAYNKLNGIDQLEYAEAKEVSKLIQKYKLNKPYYARKAVGSAPVTICNEFMDKKCTNKYIVTWSEQEQELSKNIKVKVQYPLIPQEVVIAPLLLVKLDSPNLKTHSIGYKKWWDCSNPQFGIEDCVYNLVSSGQKFYANEPIQGTVRVGKSEIKGNWQKCGNKAYKNKNRELCALKIKNIWPGTVSRISVEIMHPPKYDGEFAAIEFEQLAPKAHYFTTGTDTKATKNGEKNEALAVAAQKMKNICFGDITTCKNKYYGGTTAHIAGSSTNRFVGRSWSKRVTLKIQNRGDKRPLQSKMYYKMKGTFVSSSIWRRYLGFSYQPPFVENEFVFDMKAPSVEMLEIDCEFEPKQVTVGQTVEVYISVKNKQNGFRRAGLRSAFKSNARLSHEYQNIDVVLTPIGSGNGESSNIGLEPIKNIIQIRKRSALSMKRALTPAKFKVLSVGTQCVAFEIKGRGKPYYKDKKPQCVDVIGELKAEYVGIGESKDNDINTLINDEQSNKFKLKIKTGSEVKLLGHVVLTPKINGVKPYEFSIDPPVLDTQSCRTDCVLPFDFTPKLMCAFSDNSDEFKVNAEITWTASYTVNGRNVYFPKPTPIKVVIVERKYDDDDELLDFKERYPAKYKRWKQCKDSAQDINKLEPCDQVAIEKRNMTDCVPTDQIDDDDEILKEIQSEKMETQKRLKWYQDFWQNNWDWQYAVIGSATVFIAFAMLAQVGCIGGSSVLLEMLQNMTNQ
eukprot:279611_1